MVEKNTGAMVALIPSEAHAKELTFRGSRPQGDLHSTLFFLGEAADIHPLLQEGLSKGIQMLSTFSPVEGRVDGHAVLGQNDPEHDTVSAYIWSSGYGALPSLKANITSQLSALGIGYSRKFYPWLAHITIADGVSHTEKIATRCGRDVVFDRVRLAFGEEIIDVPLLGG